MSFFKSLFGGGGKSGGGGGFNFMDLPNPANSAMPYLNQIPGAVGEYYKPFINEGALASGVSNPVYNRMTENPTDFIDAIMRSYSPSEGYKFKEKYLTQAARNAAAQGGFAGTPTSQLEQADLVRGLLGEDMQQYLANILGVQQQGLQGQENRIGRGFQAGLGYGDILGSNLGQQAGLAFQGQSQLNQNAIDQQRMNFERQQMDRARRDNRRNAFFKTLGNAAGVGAKMLGFGGF